MEQEKVHVRLLIFAGCILLWITAVFGRVAYIQLFCHADYRKKSSPATSALDRNVSEARRDFRS